MRPLERVHEASRGVFVAIRVERQLPQVAMEPGILRLVPPGPRRQRRHGTGSHEQAKMAALPMVCLLWGFVNSQVQRAKEKALRVVVRLVRVRHMSPDTFVAQQTVWRNDAHSKGLASGYVVWTTEWCESLLAPHSLSQEHFVAPPPPPQRT